MLQSWEREREEVFEQLGRVQVLQPEVARFVEGMMELS